MILQGDALVKLAEIESGSIDAIITDLPFCSGGFSEATKMKARSQGVTRDQVKGVSWFAGDNMTLGGFTWLIRQVALEWERVLKSETSLLIFTDWRMVHHLVPNGKKEHHNEKPVELLAELLKVVTKEGDLVLDTFCGSGSMAEACHKLGRQFLGIDKNPHHAATATAREQRTEQSLAGSLFSTTDPKFSSAPSTPARPPCKGGAVGGGCPTPNT